MLDMQKAGCEFKAPGTGKIVEISETDDIAATVKMFRQASYILWYLEIELGITGWSEKTAATYATILNKCCSKVIDACQNSLYPVREAAQITKYSEKQQQELLAAWIDGDLKRYYQLRENVSTVKKSKLSRQVGKETAKTISKGLKNIEKSLNEMESEISESNHSGGVSSQEVIAEIRGHLANIYKLAEDLKHF